MYKSPFHLPNSVFTDFFFSGESAQGQCPPPRPGPAKELAAMEDVPYTTPAALEANILVAESEMSSAFFRNSSDISNPIRARTESFCINVETCFTFNVISAQIQIENTWQDK